MDMLKGSWAENLALPNGLVSSDFSNAQQPEKTFEVGAFSGFARINFNRDIVEFVFHLSKVSRHKSL